MPTMPARRLVNPRLRPYFAIFAASYVALVLVALIAEQLGAQQSAVRWAILVGPVALYVVIGLATQTGEALEFFAAGRRVPAVYVGTTLGVTAMGGTGLVAITGAFFLIGFDALCMAIGGVAGFVVMGILLAPFFRKFGAYTIPSYLGGRFESTALRLLAAVLVAVPLFMVIVAELRMAAFTASLATGAPPTVIVAITAATLLATLLPGGVRSSTWVGMAQTIVTILALLVPVTIVAIMLTNLPIPQLGQGPTLRGLSRLEVQQGLPIVLAPGLAFDMPGFDPVATAKRYAAPFGAIGPHGFVTAMLTIMMGVAAAPWLLPRLATAPGVYHARKTIGWATLTFGLLTLTMASIAIFDRHLLLTATAAGTLPEWVQTLVSQGHARLDGRSAVGETGPRSLVQTIEIARDAVLTALPMAGGLSGAFVAIAASGAFAACLLGASAAISSLAATLSEDLWYGARKEPPADRVRVAGARAALFVVVLITAAAAIALPADPLALLLWALALTGSTLFSVLVLSIWWKRINTFGAVAGIASGFSVAAIAIVSGSLEILAIDPALAGMFGIPASAMAAIVVSLITPQPSRQVLELVRDIRVPGGEILYDREMRLLRLKKRERTTAM